MKADEHWSLHNGELLFFMHVSLEMAKHYVVFLTMFVQGALWHHMGSFYFPCIDYANYTLPIIC